MRCATIVLSALNSFATRSRRSPPADVRSRNRRTLDLTPRGVRSTSLRTAGFVFIRLSLSCSDIEALRSSLRFDSTAQCAPGGAETRAERRATDLCGEVLRQTPRALDREAALERTRLAPTSPVAEHASGLERADGEHAPEQSAHVRRTTRRDFFGVEQEWLDGSRADEVLAQARSVVMEAHERFETES